MKNNISSEEIIEKKIKKFLGKNSKENIVNKSPFVAIDKKNIQAKVQEILGDKFNNRVRKLTESEKSGLSKSLASIKTEIKKFSSLTPSDKKQILTAKKNKIKSEPVGDLTGVMIAELPVYAVTFYPLNTLSFALQNEQDTTNNKAYYNLPFDLNGFYFSTPAGAYRFDTLDAAVLAANAEGGDLVISSFFSGIAEGDYTLNNGVVLDTPNTGIGGSLSIGGGSFWSHNILAVNVIDGNDDAITYTGIDETGALTINCRYIAAAVHGFLATGTGNVINLSTENCGGNFDFNDNQSTLIIVGSTTYFGGFSISGDASLTYNFASTKMTPVPAVAIPGAHWDISQVNYYLLPGRMALIQGAVTSTQAANDDPMFAMPAGFKAQATNIQRMVGSVLTIPTYDIELSGSSSEEAYGIIGAVPTFGLNDVVNINYLYKLNLDQAEN